MSSMAAHTPVVTTAHKEAAAGLISPTSPALRSQTKLPYGYRDVHADLEAGKYSGRYGADHTAYQ
jgi:hypothetical protein